MSRSGTMLCYPFEEKRLTKWDNEFNIYQHKLDGCRGRAILDNGSTIQLLSSEENDRNFALPHIKHQLEIISRKLTQAGIFELDGEFYNHDLCFEDITSRCSRSSTRHPDHLSVQYHIFDHIVCGPTCFTRISELNHVRSVIEAMPNLVLVPSFIVKTLAEIMGCFQGSINLNYEGMIIRNPNGPYKRARSTDIMKFKPSQFDIYTIIGYEEEIAIDGTPKNRLGSLACTSDEGTVFSVSAGLNDADRDKYWNIRESLPGMKVKIYYQATSKYGKPKFTTNLEILSV